jgi:hypothetical protein
MLESVILWKVKTNWNIISLLNTSKAKMENIYIFIVSSLNVFKKIIRHLTCYEIYVCFQTQILFMHSSNKPRLISILYIV